jgi:hypothetical protein
MYLVPSHTLICVSSTRQVPCPGSLHHWVAKETPSRQEGLQAGPQRTGRHHHPPGFLVGGIEEVASAIDGQSLLASELRQTRGKEVSKKLHYHLAEDEKVQRSTPTIIQHRRPGSKHPKYGIPTEHWTTVSQRVLEKKESLRRVADDFGVSHETIRRVVRAFPKMQAD